MTIKKKIFLSVSVILLCAIILTAILVPLHFTDVHFSDPSEGITLPIVNLKDIGGSRYEVDKRDSYLAHPDMLLANDGRLIVTYTEGHGKGPLQMKESYDFGQSWSERRTDTPSSWESSQETSTLYNLRFVDGHGNFTDETVMIMISGCPKWSGTTIKKNGFNCSMSWDDGRSWTQFENFFGRAWAKGKIGKSAYDCIVAMSSLTQIKENGKFVNKWMGTFHDHSFKNYKTYLTFNKNKNGDYVMSWTTPEPMFKNWRSYENKYNICEAEIIRTPSADGSRLDGNTLIMLCRTNKHKSGSVILFSDDEGASWSCPKLLPPELTGDRHKAEYDPISQKLVISLRHIDANGKRYSALSTTHAILSMGWIGWVGTFEDLLSYRNDDASTHRLGEKLILFSSGYKNGGDCGYSGTAFRDGQFVMVSYGTFDEDATEPYILAVRFSL